METAQFQWSRVSFWSKITTWVVVGKTCRLCQSAKGLSYFDVLSVLDMHGPEPLATCVLYSFALGQVVTVLWRRTIQHWAIGLVLCRAMTKRTFVQSGQLFPKWKKGEQIGSAKAMHDGRKQAKGEGAKWMSKHLISRKISALTVAGWRCWHLGFWWHEIRNTIAFRRGDGICLKDNRRGVPKRRAACRMSFLLALPTKKKAPAIKRRTEMTTGAFCNNLPVAAPRRGLTWTLGSDKHKHGETKDTKWKLRSGKWPLTAGHQVAAKFDCNVFMGLKHIATVGSFWGESRSFPSGNLANPAQVELTKDAYLSPGRKRKDVHAQISENKRRGECVFFPSGKWNDGKSARHRTKDTENYFVNCAEEQCSNLLFFHELRELFQQVKNLFLKRTELTSKNENCKKKMKCSGNSFPFCLVSFWIQSKKKKNFKNTQQTCADNFNGLKKAFP